MQQPKLTTRISKTLVALSLIAFPVMYSCNSTEEKKEEEKKDSVTAPTTAPAAKPDSGATAKPDSLKPDTTHKKTEQVPPTKH